MLRALRLLRAFRLTRYANSMNLLLQVLRDEGPVISAALFVLLMMITVAASITYLAEHKTQPEAFASIPHALWWAVVTMTTVGYGDITPTNDNERRYTIFTLILGALVFGYMLGEISSLVAAMDRQAAIKEEKMGAIKEYLRFRNVPRDLQSRVRKFYEYYYTRVP